jgi:hypothetical protein
MGVLCTAGCGTDVTVVRHCCVDGGGWAGHNNCRASLERNRVLDPTGHVRDENAVACLGRTSPATRRPGNGGDWPTGTRGVPEHVCARVEHWIQCRNLRGWRRASPPSLHKHSSASEQDGNKYHDECEDEAGHARAAAARVRCGHRWQYSNRWRCGWERGRTTGWRDGGTTERLRCWRFSWKQCWCGRRLGRRWCTRRGRR